MTICESICRVHDTLITNYDKLEKVFENITPEGILYNLLENAVIGSSSKCYSGLKQKTWQSIMIILRNICKYSARCYEYMVKYGILGIVKHMLCENNKEDIENDEELKSGVKEIREDIIPLLDALLPQNHSSDNNANYKELETMKEEYLRKESMSDFIKAILPCVMTIYDESARLSIKLYSLQIINKLWN